MSLENPNRFAAFLKNGNGTIITRLTVWALPFLFMAATWAGGLIFKLESEKILSAIERIDARVDRLSDFAVKSSTRIGNLEAGQASQAATVEGLRDRLNDRMTRR